jgi:hypothetical protein
MALRVFCDFSEVWMNLRAEQSVFVPTKLVFLLISILRWESIRGAA